MIVSENGMRAVCAQRQWPGQGCCKRLTGRVPSVTIDGFRGVVVFDNRPTEDIARAVLAGAGVRMNVLNRSTSDLIRIAQTSATKGSRVIFIGVETRPTDDMVRIASAGKGCVSFE